jgi:hypothetical protein
MRMVKLLGDVVQSDSGRTADLVGEALRHSSEVVASVDWVDVRSLAQGVPKYCESSIFCKVPAKLQLYKEKLLWVLNRNAAISTVSIKAPINGVPVRCAQRRQKRENFFSFGPFEASNWAKYGKEFPRWARSCAGRHPPTSVLAID